MLRVKRMRERGVEAIMLVEGGGEGESDEGDFMG